MTKVYKSVYINNCTKSQLDQLPNEAVLQFGETAIVTYFSLSRAAQLSTGDLVGFSNDHLIQIGQATNNLGNFLARFSNDRLLNPPFSNETMLQLPTKTLDSFSCDVQKRLGRTVSGCASSLAQPSYYTPYTTPSDSLPSETLTLSPTQPLVKKPVKIIITRPNQPDQILDPSANLNEVKLSLNFDDKGIADVRFQVNYDSFGGDVKAYYVRYKLKQKPAENIPNSENQTQNIKVLELKYFPLDKTKTKLDSKIAGADTNIYELRNKVSSISTTIVDYLSRSSHYHGYKINSSSALTYTIIDSKEILEPLPLSNNRIPWGDDHPFRSDYFKIFEPINICDYVDNKGISEVWLWGYHTKEVEINESNMSMGTKSKAFWNFENYGDVSNSERINDLPICNRTYTVYDMNYQREHGEVFESRGHQIEALLLYVDYELFWNKFVKPNGEKDGVNHCGWTHSGPNVGDRITGFNNYTRGGQYDWVNETKVQSDCEDWKPEGGGQVKTVDCHTWYQYTAGNVCPGSDTGVVTDGGLPFKMWWMQNLPGMNNGLVYKGNNLRNWWVFVADFDKALASGKSLVARSSKTTLQSADSLETQTEPKYIPPASLPHHDDESEESVLPLLIPLPTETPKPNTPFPISQPTPTPPPIKLIDFNNDGVINVFDYIDFSKKKLGL